MVNADPKVPAGHSEHTAAPPVEYRPGMHGDTVATVDPAGHAYPALQSPLHAAVVSASPAP
jgi:hypothetical protein